MNPSLQLPVASSSCSVSQVDFHGWDTTRLANGIIELFVVPQIGGRILQLRLAGKDLFYVNTRHLGRVYRAEENDFQAGWKNYGGSKVWPAPQGWSGKHQWPGPPDPILDGGSYRLRVLGDQPDTVAVYLKSPQDEYTGLTFAREIRIFRDSSSVRIRHEMCNTSSRPVRWGIWQVTQQAANNRLSVFVPDTTYRQLYGDQVYGCVEAASDKGSWRLRYCDQVAKFLLRPEKGWTVTLHGESGVALVETFPVFKGLPYPDDARFEVWVNGKGSFTIDGRRVDMVADGNGCDPFIETEILSPFIELEPNQSYAFEILWNCATLEGDAVSSVGCLTLITKPLTLTRQDKQLKVTGAYGFFRVGRLEIVSTFRDGREVPGPVSVLVSPLEPCSVEEPISYEDGMSKVSLRLRDLEGKVLDTVDEAAL